MKTRNFQDFINRKYLVFCDKLYVLLIYCESSGGQVEQRQLKKVIVI